MDKRIEEQSQKHGFPVAPSVNKKRACEFLAISISTLDRLVAAELIIPIRIGRHVTFDMNDLVAFRNARKVATYAGQ